MAEAQAIKEAKARLKQEGGLKMKEDALAKITTDSEVKVKDTRVEAVKLVPKDIKKGAKNGNSRGYSSPHENGKSRGYSSPHANGHLFSADANGHLGVPKLIFR